MERRNSDILTSLSREIENDTKGIDLSEYTSLTPNLYDRMFLYLLGFGS
jgi:hypothetical protein